MPPQNFVPEQRAPAHWHRIEIALSSFLHKDVSWLSPPFRGRKHPSRLPAATRLTSTCHGQPCHENNTKPVVVRDPHFSALVTKRTLVTFGSSSS